MGTNTLNICTSRAASLQIKIIERYRTALPTYHFHVDSLLGKLPVHDELHLVVLELVLQGGHVVAVLGAVLGQGGHFPPAQLPESRDVGVSGKWNLSSIKLLVDAQIKTEPDRTRRIEINQKYC